MAKKKRPASQKPKPNEPTIGEAIQHWFEYGGGNPRGKGRATIEGDDPRNQDSEDEIVWEGDIATYKPGKQLGKPEIHLGHTGEPGDTSLIGRGSGHTDGSGELGDTSPFTAAQMEMLLEELFGNKGAALNKDILKLTPSSRINTQGPGAIPLSGSRINTPGVTLPGGPKVREFPGLPHSGLRINNPPPSTLDLLSTHVNAGLSGLRDALARMARSHAGAR